MFLGIEIGGSKLQLGVGRGDGSPLIALRRMNVQAADGAEGILRQIEAVAAELLAEHPVKAVGIGFGGPVDTKAGRVIKSHHVALWDEFPLAQWCGERWKLPVALANDADTAGLAEATFGAGQSANPVFYVTVGSGVGGGLILHGRIYQGHAAAAAEIGHLRPGPAAERSDETVESLASGWGIAAAAAQRLLGPIAHRFSTEIADKQPEEVRQYLIDQEESTEKDVADLLDRCDGDTKNLTAKMVFEATGCGNEIARELTERATVALGWAVAQVVTLLSLERIVIGGGVSLAGEELFLDPLRKATARYVFPPLRETYEIVPAQFQEEVVVQGALVLAAGECAG